MGYTNRHPDADVPEGKRLPGRTAEERASDHELVIQSAMDEDLMFIVKLPKKKLDQHTPDDVPAEPE